MDQSAFRYWQSSRSWRQICCDPSLCFDRYRGGSAKLDTCMELITGGIAGDHKILLFSQFTSMLELIGQRLKKEGIAFHLLTEQPEGRAYPHGRSLPD